MEYVGIDIGGTEIKAGLVNDAGAVRGTRKTATIGGNLDGLIATLANLVTQFQTSTKVEAVGVGIPGLRSLATGVIETSPHIPCLRAVPFEKLLTERFGLPVVTENDAKSGAYGELVCGAGRKWQHMAYITLGTGLGCGLILSGKVFRGALGYAGELGHMTIELDGRPCACGAFGCLETRVSAKGIVATARERGFVPDKDFTAADVYTAAVAGDSIAKSVFDETARYLGMACATLINLLNLEGIVLGGGVAASADLLLPGVRNEVQRRAFAPAARHCPIVQSQLWPDAGMIGAAMLARDR